MLSNTSSSKAKVTKSLTLTLSLIGLLLGGLARGQDNSLSKPIVSGMWVWHEETYQTVEQRARLLKFCRDHQFNHLDVSVQIEKKDGRASVVDPDELTDLLTRAAEAKVSICALRGSQRMFFETNYPATLAELQAIIEFNNRLPVGLRFTGVKYDVEPHTLAEWRQGGPIREKIMRDYLGCLERIRETLVSEAKAAPRIKLSVDIPFWWHKPDLKVEFGGQTKPFSQHIQDLTDSVTLMSYRRDPEEVKRIVESEREYAVKIGKQVLPGLLHSKAHNPADTPLSFYGLPTSEYLRVRHELEDWASHEAGIGGIMHHHYGSLSNSLETAVTP